MKYLKHIALAILIGAIFSVSAYADGKPNGGPPNGGPGKGSVYGLSDSCWNVFLSEISPADAAKLAADQATIVSDQAQIDTLNKQIGALLKGSVGRRDTTNRAKINALEVQIQALEKAGAAAQMDIDSIIQSNGKLYSSIEENCGRHIMPPDTNKGHGNPPPPPNTNSRGHFGLSDSCWNIFLTQIAPADAAQLAADQKTISDNQAQIDTLLKQIRGIKGSLKDSTVRAEIKALVDQINTIAKASGAAEKDYATIIKKYDAILQSIRTDCGRTITHKGGAGDPTNGFQVTSIVPDPVTVGAPASLTITMSADANVTITIGSAMAQGQPMKQLFNGLLTAGIHTETLDLSGLGAGVYLVVIQSGNEQVTQKLVIQ